MACAPPASRPVSPPGGVTLPRAKRRKRTGDYRSTDAVWSRTTSLVVQETGSTVLNALVTAAGDLDLSTVPRPADETFAALVESCRGRRVRFRKARVTRWAEVEPPAICCYKVATAPGRYGWAAVQRSAGKPHLALGPRPSPADTQPGVVPLDSDPDRWLADCYGVGPPVQVLGVENKK